MKLKINIKLLQVLLILVFTSCTDLEERVLDEIMPDDIHSVENAERKLLSASYNYGEEIFARYKGIWCVNQLTTDEAILPARGKDWYDNGSWIALHEFTWDASSVRSGNLWDNLNKAVAQSAITVDVIKNSEIANKDMYIAEALGLWTLYTYHIVDIFGQVPYRDPMNVNFSTIPEVLNSSKAIELCISTLERILPDLPKFESTEGNSGRFTAEAAYALLAQIYLNKSVYDDRYNATSEFDFTAGGNMDKVIEYTDLIISSNKFTLEKYFFDIFGVDNSGNSEHIFSVIQKATGGNEGRNEFTYLSMGRNQKANPDNNRGSNATCTTPEYYATWDNNRNDPRFHSYTKKNGGEIFRNDGTDVSLPYDGVFHFNRGFQEGQQYGPTISDGDFNRDPNNNSRVLVEALYTEQTPGLLLDFTKELNFDDPSKAIFSQNQINRGIRVFKQEYDAENTRKYGGVDIPVFRLGGIYTMRAEAKFRKGDVNGALNDINLLRESRSSVKIDGKENNGKAIDQLNEETLYNEISYEMYWECARRQQMIRFGKFEDAYTAKPVSQPFRRVFPIPQYEMDVNKFYVQNKGY